jgi:hypothetical protein
MGFYEDRNEYSGSVKKKRILCLMPVTMGFSRKGFVTEFEGEGVKSVRQPCK